MLELSIDSIRVSLMNYQRVVILRVDKSDRYLPIWIGPSEADSIALRLQNVSVPRPLTHDLLRSVIVSLGATVSRVVVSDLSDDTFYAKVVLQYDETTLEVDARPSDAIALAVRMDAPIFADETVIEKASVQMEDGAGKVFVPGEDGLLGDRPVREEELESLSAFTDFVDTLNLDGFGREEKPPEANTSETV